MANELTKKEESTIAILETHDLSDIMKPLIKEIHLFDSFIAGTSYIEDQSIFDSLKEGDMLGLLREDNKFDDNAIMIVRDDKKKLGYVPAKDNIVFARLMDAGKCLKAKVTKIEKKGSFNMISIGIYLVDF